MAKGRKATLNPHDRLLGSFSYAHGHAATAADLPDLGEDDVWSVVAADGAGSDGEASGDEGWCGDDGAGRVGPHGRGRRHYGGLSLAFDGAGDRPAARVVHQCRNADNSAPWHRRSRHQQVAASAPVNVRGWPGGVHSAGSAETPPGHAEWDGGDGGDDPEWVPPHEYLARGGAASRRSATATAGSVFEGVGRTLKGRDMRRLRDAVWSQTGFYG
uniref:Uncharacterized protein n=1 Tax=Anthurium amnicola TaxID=1678845 RepID=A0A1D1YAK2_9ARAE